jgi:hypothetical protein
MGSERAYTRGYQEKCRLYKKRDASSTTLFLFSFTSSWLPDTIDRLQGLTIPSGRCVHELVLMLPGCSFGYSGISIFQRGLPPTCANTAVRSGDVVRPATLVCLFY